MNEEYWRVARAVSFAKYMYIHMFVSNHTRESIMKSFTLNNSKWLALLASAALLTQVSAAHAAGTEEAQSQAQHLLGGRPLDRARLLAIAATARTESRSAVDPQDQARRLIVGEPHAPGNLRQGDARGAKTAHAGRLPGTDAQALAQRMILGAG
jgi:hypothetical protein